MAVFILVSGLTTGTILRAAGGIFAGWGEDEPPESRQPQEDEEETETLPQHDRTPATMLAPAAVMTAAALVVSVVPGLADAIQEGAGRFTETAAYGSTVLHGHGVFTAVETKGYRAVDFAWGAISLLLALGVAGVSLFGRRLLDAVPGPIREAIDVVGMPLRAIHSGHVGDYLAWLTAGAGGVAVLLTLAVR